MTYNLLLIDDNESFTTLLKTQIEESNDDIDEQRQHYKCDAINNPLHVLDYLQKNSCDLIILDLQMPEMNGTELCQQIRQKNYYMPVIFLSAMDDDVSQISALNLGANDYVHKPVRLQPLLARIRSQLRQFEQMKNPSVKIGTYHLNMNDKLLTHDDGTVVHLVEKEIGIIRYLLNKPNSEASKGELLEEVWGYNRNVITHTLESHVYRLRKKLKEKCGDEILVTCKMGYRLVA